LAGNRNCVPACVAGGHCGERLSFGRKSPIRDEGLTGDQIGAAEELGANPARPPDLPKNAAGGESRVARES
jgi:hypothetical protein